jgi:hypothetical protein
MIYKIKYLYFFSILLSFGLGLSSQDQNAEIPIQQSQVMLNSSGDSLNVFNKVDEMPEFPGGDKQLLKFLAKNLQMPESTYGKQIDGTSMVKFIIDTLGNVLNPVVIKNFPNCPNCDEEALRVVKKLPKWKPGKSKDGKLENVFYTIPVRMVFR